MLLRLFNLPQLAKGSAKRIASQDTSQIIRNGTPVNPDGLVELPPMVVAVSLPGQFAGSQSVAPA